ncbi:MAG: T9SS type A sorting domain-containing protein [Bacteroidales bacterium]|nr:T9SS type A sorting domain-containing protein [Bacteroidales bacterium]
MKRILSFLCLLFPLFVWGQSTRIGDILCTDGSTIRPEQFASSGKTAEGVVFYVDNSGQQGWAVNLHVDANDIDWVNELYYYDGFDIPDLPNLEYSRDDLFDLDGYQNTAIIRAAHGADWFPAAWAVDFDHGWYLPSAGQLRWLIAYANEVNASMTVVHGTPFTHTDPDRWYWSSTEQDAMHAIVVSEGGSTANYMKWNYYNTVTIGVRSIKNFSIAKRNSHHIGDVVVTAGGQKGIVFYVSPEDDSYWLVALNDLSQKYAWGNEQDIAGLDNYPDRYYVLHGVHCGYDATTTMKDSQGANTQYAASHVNLDNGWHIPSAGQMSKLFAALPHIENQLIANGGISPSNDYYWTSTERDASEAWMVNFGGNPYQEGAIRAAAKSELYSVRPVWSEPCNIDPPTPIPGLPDNIIENDCNDNSPIPFHDGQLMYQTDNNVNVYSTPVCGDIDDDGLVDIVVALYTGNFDTRHFSNTIGVYSGNNLSLQNTISIPQEIYLQYCPYGLVRYPKEDGTIQGAIVVVCCDDKLRSYSRTGQLLNTSDHEVPCHGTPSFADFNHDGYPEVYIGNAIYDAATLKMLCQGPSSDNKGLSHRGSIPGTYNHRTYNAIPFAYDVVGDEKAELICGNTIYNVNIVSRTNPNLNSVTVNKTITPPNGYPQDGQVAIADFDLDGKVEVLVVNDPTYDNIENGIYYYAYKPLTGQILFSFTHYARGTNYPAICNIDDDPYPEILLTDYLLTVPDEQMYCLRYTPGTGLNTIWSTGHNDPSGMTTMAFFDFNLDEIPEIVYRDGHNLNIINGQNGQVLYSYPMHSGTASEHAIVADVNKDGHAEIIADGFLDYDYGTNGYGSLTMFGDENWPMTRHVWNQYAYNVTNVNDDLTVPTTSFDNATVFTAPDGTIRRPYNNFLQQAGYITPQGKPYNPSSYVEAEHYGEGCETYRFHGITYTESGNYELFIENPLGCDTIFTVHVQLGDTIHVSKSESVCQPYIWNGITYDESGIYQQTFTSAQGCDSIVTLNLTVNALYQVSPIYGDTLIPNQQTGHYTYYIDPIPGAFGYHWTLNGPWEVTFSPDSPECVVNITSQDSYTLTVRIYTECGYIEKSILIQHAAGPDIKVFPNPTQNDFKIALHNMEGETIIVIMNYLGQIIDRFIVDANPYGTIVPYSLKGKAAGVYMVTIINHYQWITKRISKETPADYGTYHYW